MVLKTRWNIVLEGVVQGVGLRPFIYNLARERGLSGYVCNDTHGAVIEVEGKVSTLEEFLSAVKTDLPANASLEKIGRRDIPLKGESGFSILNSLASEERRALIAPDTPTCEECIKELFDPSNRRYLYPFLNCTHCGPRFTIIRDVPYDRMQTTMSVFQMCADCLREYEDPENRRFHAQPNACPKCGPKVNLLDSKGESVMGCNPVAEATRLIRQGSIIAIKSLGGYQLACDAFNQTAVSRLRIKKYRWDKPFALMARDMDAVKKLCFVGPEEEALLTSLKNPICLLKKKETGQVAESVAPSQKTLGLMLPYTPLHHILLKQSETVLVMTSGNYSENPIEYKDEEAIHSLNGIADYFLIHDREIHMRADDSVSRIILGKELILRRARGYTPHPVGVIAPFVKPILACGGHFKNTFCLGKDRHAFVSHHIGDLENYETLKSMQEGIEHFQNLFDIKPEVVAYDLHPDYLSTQYALKIENIQKIGVQHHHAHIASCMAEHGLNKGPVIGVAFDGAGYGTDGTIWGGEFLVADYRGFFRAAHLKYVPMPGGEAAIREPWRIAAACLHQIYGEKWERLEIDFVKRLEFKRLRIIQQMMDKNLNCPLTSSMGRLFDAVASLLGIRDSVNYEGQAAVELENLADETCIESYPWDTLFKGFPLVVDIDTLVKAIVTDIINEIPASIISSKFHNSLVEMIVSVCSSIRKRKGLSRVVLSGGVFQNAFLLTRVVPRLEMNGFQVYVPQKVPPNDGGISLGQAIIANARVAEDKNPIPIEG